MTKKAKELKRLLKEIIINQVREKNKFPAPSWIVSAVTGSYKEYNESDILEGLESLVKEKFLLKDAGGHYSLIQGIGNTGIGLYQIIKYSLYAIGIGSAILSVWFSQLWFSGRTHIIVAWALSVFMVGANIGSFELFIVILKKVKGFGKLLSLPFFLIWIVTLGLSISFTIAGQMKVSQENELKNHNVENSGKIRQIERLENEIKDMDTSLSELKESLAGLNVTRVNIEKDIESKRVSLEKMVENGQGESYEYNVKNWQKGVDETKLEKHMKLVTAKEKEIADKEKEKSDKYEQISRLELTGVNYKLEEKTDFFTWAEAKLSGKVKADKIEFILYTLPAILLDVIACLFLVTATVIKKDLFDN